MGINSNIDILKKVADMERLKCELLFNTAEFFKAAALGGDDVSGRQNGAASLCALLANVYLLAAQAGVSPEELDEKAAFNLRALVLNGEESAEVKMVLRHLS